MFGVFLLGECLQVILDPGKLLNFCNYVFETFEHSFGLGCYILLCLCGVLNVLIERFDLIALAEVLARPGASYHPFYGNVLACFFEHILSRSFLADRPKLNAVVDCT
mgnify:CR=1 FL=1